MRVRPAARCPAAQTEAWAHRLAGGARRGGAPVKVPDALRLQLGARERVRGTEVPEQAGGAVAGNLPNSEEA